MTERRFLLRADGVCLLVLLAATLIVYARVLAADFVVYDDVLYVSDNKIVQSGLTLAGIRWAFTTGHANNWHPVTWISHMIDCQLFGLNAFGHHLTNLLLHAANTLLLFWFLRRATGLRGRSFCVAALFALHPQHVESVAWVAERKDVLSTFFGMLALLAYLRYVERPAWRPYWVMALCFACGLMAKPMLVTLPCVMLLLDYWPFQRFRRVGALVETLKLIAEKLPLFALAAASSIVTVIVQNRGGSVLSLDRLPVSLRIAHTPVAYVHYLAKTIWPSGLVAFYPHPGDSLSSGAVATSVAILLLLTVLAFAFARSRGYLAMGWLWYLGTLLPVIGIVQVGKQAFADRYTYLPLIGIFIAVVWGVADLMGGTPRRRAIAIGCAAAVLLGFSAATVRQTGYWQSPFALFERSVAVTPDSAEAHYALGLIYFKRNQLPQAADQFWTAMQLDPNHVPAITKLGKTLKAQGQLDKALQLFYAAVSLNPEDAVAQTNLAMALMEKGDRAEGMKWFTSALALTPNDPDIHYNLGLGYSLDGQFDAAAQHFSEAVRLRPDDAEAWYGLGVAQVQRGQREEARRAFSEALRLQPSHPAARAALDQLP